MNIQSLHKFIHWFVFYINNLNCEFNWNIFDDVFELETPQPKILFFTAVVSKLYDIIDASKNSILTDLIKKLSVPKRDFYLQFNSDDSKLQIMRVLAFGIKEKKNNQQIIQDLENNARQLKFDSIIGPILTTLLKGGYKTPSHTISIIDKYSSILEQFNKNENDHMECISAAYYFWKNNPTRIKHIIQLLEQRKFINSHDILNWFLNLQYEQKSVELLPWDVIFTYINIYTCNFIKYKTEYSKLKIIDKTKESYDLGENQQQQSDEQLTTAKHKKETAKEERKKLLLLIVEKICVCISNYVEDCQAQNKPLVCTWFVYILQRLQQILFENIGCFCYLHEFLQSLIDFSNNEEHVVEILKRFQSIYT
uniref:Nuclear cap-binding protein subunit 1-B (Trinotate prediction) n=1 Tax=Henneguya salminicola TaxID=69463 RepID=A0A6G3MF71_HENSL